jgi:modification methylase
MEYPIDFINKFVCGSAVEMMEQIPDGSVDLVITSPPYNLKNSTGGGMKNASPGGIWQSPELLNGYSDHTDNMPHHEYVTWQKKCLTEMFRIIPDDGAIFYNHKWRVQDGRIQDRQDIVQDFPVRQIIIWQRSGGTNFNPGYFLPTYEVIYLIAKPKFKLVEKANAVGDIWNFHQQTKSKHPAPFPVELPYRIISSTTAKSVLDPFMGSGTTAIAAKKLNVDFIGIDISQVYCDMANKRMDDPISINKPNKVKNYAPVDGIWDE